jgi:hypothetical protein
MRMKISKTSIVIVALLCSNLILMSIASMSSSQVSAQPFVFDMFMVTPLSVTVPFDTAFQVNITNLRNESIWVFCLAQQNISRIDAPVFMTLAANSSYLYSFKSPPAVINQTELNTIYSVYFGAVDESATSFQTAEVVLDMTTVDTLNVRLLELIDQNQQLMQQMMILQQKADSNNFFIVLTVATNIFWVCLILFIRMNTGKGKNVLAVTEPKQEPPAGS